MPRLPRELKPGYSYHITSRCNNREFRLTRLSCRELLLYAIKKALQKFQFKLYGRSGPISNNSYPMDPPVATNGRQEPRRSGVPRRSLGTRVNSEGVRSQVVDRRVHR